MGSSVRTYARYISRLAFVWVSVYSVIVGLKIGKKEHGVMGLKIDKKWCCKVKEDHRKIKGNNLITYLS